MNKALITGISGFAGSHLADLLLSHKIKVYGFYYAKHPLQNISHIKDKLELFSIDITNDSEVYDAIKKINPDLVFHLAASSSPSQSFKEPKQTFQNNVFGQINLLDALKRIKSKAKILVIGSAEEYGPADEKLMPLKEDAPLNPSSPYAISKVAQDFLGYQYHLHEKLHIIRVRPFNHIGPRQSQAFVVPAFASQIARLEKEAKGVIKVGNLNSYRDFTDVRDMVKAYFLALSKGEKGDVYNIGSGKVVKIAQILDILLSFSKAKIKIEIDKSRYAPVEIKSISCNYSKFKKTTGWEPQITLKTTLFDTINYERKILDTKP